MILDTLANASLYRSISPTLAIALDALLAGDLPNRADGKYPLDGDRVFAMVQRYTTKPPADCIWESHRKYIDVQFIGAGVECIDVVPIDTVTTKTPYDPGRDATFYHPPVQAIPARLILPAGTFAVLFPHDVHSPCIAPAAGPGEVVKVVIKVAV
jgi:YhcH/YjgK/YiaL family protein